MSEYISGGLTLAAIITLLALYRKQCKYSNIKGKESAYAGVWWICIFACGLLLYFIACVSSSRPEGQSVVSFILLSIAKSLSASLKMFSFNFETSIIFNIASANGAAGYIFCAAVVACFISAASWTIIMAKNVFLKGIGNEFDIFFHAHKGWHRRFFPKIPPSKHYIVIGCGQARLFLENLVKTVNKKNITVITGQNADKEKYRDLIAKGYTVIFGKADELTLRRAGIFNKNCKTIVVAMSEKDEENLFVAKFITNYVREKVKPQKQANGRIASLTAGQIEILKSIDISVYAMYSYLERSEHFSFTEYALGKVRFFSPYDVRARKFIMDNPITALIPPGWINTQKGRLKSPSEREDGVNAPFKISSVFVGFGMTNKQILKKSICNNQLFGVDYRAYVIDRDTRAKEKEFRNEAIGLFDYVDENGNLIRGCELIPDPKRYFEGPAEKFDISFESIDVLSVDFYKAVIKEVQQNDFTQIIIALGNDKLSIETALEVRQKLYEADLLKIDYADSVFNRVKIFVKVGEKSVISQESIINDKYADCPITVFGENGEILTDKYIIEEMLDDIAKCIANEYWATATYGGAEVPLTNVFTKWDALTQFKRDSNRYSAMSIRIKLNLLGFDIIEGGSIRPEIMEKYDRAYGLSLAAEQRKQRESGVFVDFLERDEKGNIRDTARNNLALLEHQRWNTYHLTCGWTKLEKAKVGAYARQDEKAKQHACITTMEGLTELRDKQAEALLKEYAAQGKSLSADKALTDADVICYDFDVMDKLIDILNSNKCNCRQYVIVEREQ